jgi:hypothetical protein
MPRNIKCFDSEEQVMVDLTISWKIFDNGKSFDAITAFNGGVYEGRHKRSKYVKRVNWIETDRGPYVVEKESDYEKASKICGLSVEKIKSIFTNNKCPLYKTYIASINEEEKSTSS